MANASGLVVGGQEIPAVAEAALTKYVCVKQGTVGTKANYVITCGAGEAGIGFVDETYDAADNVTVQINGTCIAIAATGITAGQFLKGAANGQVTPVTTNGDLIVARALQTVDTQGDQVAVEIMKGTRYA